MRSIVLMLLAIAGGAMANLSNESSTSTEKASTSSNADVEATGSSGKSHHSHHSKHHHSHHHHLHGAHESISQESSRETVVPTNKQDEMGKRQVTPCNPLDPRCWEEKRAQISAATAAAAGLDTIIFHTPATAEVQSIVTKIITQTVTHIAHPQLRRPMVTPAIKYWPTVAHISGVNHTITAATQTIGDQVFVADPLMKYKMYDYESHPHAPTGACKREERKWENEDYQQEHASHWDEHENHFWNKFRLISDRRKPSDCEVERCMWHYMRPMTITSAAVYAYEDGSTMAHNWFTHETFLREPHWGTHHSRGIYYPLTSTHDFTDNSLYYYPARHTPTGLPKNKLVHGMPRCGCAESCYYDVCNRKRDADGLFDSWITFALTLVSLLVFLPAALVIAAVLLKRRRDARKGDPTVQQATVVNDATAPAVTEVRNATGETVGPTEKGTLGRRAEEGRAVGTGTGEAGPAARSTVSGTTAPPGTVGRQAEEARAAGVTSNAAGGHTTVQEAHPETHVVTGEAPQPVHNNA